MLLTTDTNALELEPTVMLVHSLKAAGIEDYRLAIALTKVLDSKREAQARAYLKAAGYQALPVSLRFERVSHDIGNRGLAISEAPQKAIAEQGRAFFDGIADALPSRARTDERGASRTNNGKVG